MSMVVGGDTIIQGRFIGGNYLNGLIRRSAI